jgi:hypothetical protein
VLERGRRCSSTTSASSREVRRGNPLAEPVSAGGWRPLRGHAVAGLPAGRVVVIVNTVNVRITKFVVVNLVRPGFSTRPIGAPDRRPRTA